MECIYGGIDQLPAAGLQPLQSANLILSHEAAIADHIGREYRGEPPLHVFAHSLDVSDRRRVSYHVEGPQAPQPIHATARPECTWRKVTHSKGDRLRTGHACRERDLVLEMTGIAVEY
ncbi:hypothetical protein SF83666_b51960 (plasmid) [Sinorhizobium fredii CCBAU 83666]|nr:hypothetical protein SF83666_b51960 [Sinorhizobium fredii CCBAU 83666]